MARSAPEVRRSGRGDAPGTPGNAAAVTGLLLRFVSCGLLCLAAGLAWKLTFAPRQVRVASALADILMLLAGFVVGGMLWYLRDVRVRNRRPESIADERIVFSFVVFVLVPLAVGVVVAVVWLIALLAGA